MKTFLLPLLAASSLPSIQSLAGIFLAIAAICLVVWGVIALIRATGVTIHPIVKIVLIVLVGLFCLGLIARFFGLA